MSNFIPGKIIKTFKSKKGNDVTLRYPEWEDVEQMTTFINELSKEDTYITFSGEINSKEEEAKYLSSLFPTIEKGDLVVVFAFVNNILVGSTDVKRVLDGKEREKHVGIFGLTVSKDYRSDGIGEELMRSTIEEAKRSISGLRIVKLVVYGPNSVARSLYKKVGFQEAGIIPGGVKYKNEFVDYVSMYLKIR